MIFIFTASPVVTVLVDRLTANIHYLRNHKKSLSGVRKVMGCCVWMGDGRGMSLSGLHIRKKGVRSSEFY